MKHRNISKEPAMSKLERMTAPPLRKHYLR